MTQITDEALIDAIQAAYNAHDWQETYGLVDNALSLIINPSPEDRAVLVWVEGARAVNGNTGQFASYIRDYTARQFELRTGESLDTGTLGPIQSASDTIAQRFIATLFGAITGPEDTPPDQITGSFSSLTVPTLDNVGLIDAGAAAADVFNIPSTGKNYSPWAGTVLFANLGEGSFFNEWVLQLGVNDHKREPGTYDLATIAQASDELRQPGSAQFELGGAVTLLQLYSLGSTTVDAEEHAADNFFADTYGVALGSFDIGYDIFSLKPVLFGALPVVGGYFQYTATYVSGLVTDDSDLDAIDGQEFVQAGRGDDTIIGAYDIGAKANTLSVIDGGDGNDTLDYSVLSAPISVSFDNVGALGPRVVADKGSDADVHTDEIYQVEHVTLSLAADTVHVPASGVTGTIDIDGSANPDDQPDTIDFSELGTALNSSNFDFGSDFFSDGDFNLNFSNFEKVVGTSSSDTFSITDDLTGNLEIDGGAQSSGAGDALDFSQYSGDLSTLDLTNEILSGTELTLKFENIEKIIGTADDDEIVLPDNTTVVQVDGGSGDDDITAGVAHAVLLGGDGDDFLTAGSGGAVLDGGISATEFGDEYFGGPGSDTFVIGNGAHGEEGLDSAITIEDPGAEDKLVLRLDVTKGFDSDANWTTGIVLNGGIYTEDPDSPSDPNFIQAEYSPITLNPIMSTGPDGSAVTGTSLDFLNPDLGDFVVIYDWDKIASTLDVEVTAKYGDFNVHIDGFENGDLGLNFIEADQPLPEWFRGSGSDVVIQNSWDAYNATLEGMVSSTQMIDLPSPGDPITGSAVPWTPTAPQAEPESVTFDAPAIFWPLTNADFDGDHFDPNNGDPVDSNVASTAALLGDQSLALDTLAIPNAAAAPNTDSAAAAITVGRVAPFAQSHPYTLQSENALVFDLDGNGLDLAGIGTTAAYVDYEGVGFASHTGWVSPSDGVLINFDGSDRITSSTILGAASGNAFADLQAFDSNSDGEIDSTDLAAANLRIWTDLDGNGAIGADEVLTLGDAGIQSIDVQSTDSADVINGNAIEQTGTFVTSQGATDTAADVAFAVDKVATEFVPPDGFTLSDGALVLSDLVGYGTVPDLRSAMSLDPSLQDQVLQLVLQSRSMSGFQFDSSFETMVQTWAGVSSIDPGSDGPLIDARHLALVEAFYGSTFEELYGSGATLDASIATDAEARYHTIVDELKVRFVADAPVFAYTNGVTLDSIESSPLLPFALIRFDSASDDIFADLNQIVSALVSLAPVDDAAKQSYFDLAGHIIEGLRVDLFNDDPAQLISAVETAAAGANLAQNWIDVLIAGLQGNTSSEINGTSGDDFMDTPSDGATLNPGLGDDTISLAGDGSDRIIFAKGDGHDTLTNPGDGYNRNDTLVLADIDPSEVQLTRSDNALIIDVSSTGDQFTVNFQFWGDGTEIQGLTGIQFGDGTLWDRTTIAENAWILGTSGDDFMDTPSDAATLDPGLGDDTISLSGDGADRIVFAKGDGHDTLTNPGDGYNRNDTLVLTDITAPEVQLTRSDNALIIDVPSTGDQFTVNFQFWGDGTEIQGLTGIQFADGTFWDRSAIAQNAWILGTSGDDFMDTPSDAATLDPGLGDDTISLAGDGSDRIVFAKGDGHDMLTNPGDGYNRNDTLVLNDINPSEVQLTRSDSALIIDVPSSGDQFTVNFQFWGDGTEIQGLTGVQFADGTFWDRATIAQNAWILGTSGDDTMDTPTDGATLDPGLGDDTISLAGDGADQIVFAKGDGHDMLTNPGGGYNRNDTLVLTDIDPSEVQLTRSDNALIIDVPSTGDQFTVNFQFWGDGTEIQGLTGIQFADGTVWDRATIAENAWVRGTASDDSIIGTSGDDNIDGLAGNDYMEGDAGNDTYRFVLGDGQDTVFDNGSTSTSEVDTLIFGDGISADNITATQINAGADVLLSIGGSMDTVTLSNQLTSNAGGVDQVKFADGTTWDRTAIASHSLAA